MPYSKGDSLLKSIKMGGYTTESELLITSCGN